MNHHEQWLQRVSQFTKNYILRNKKNESDGEGTGRLSKKLSNGRFMRYARVKTETRLKDALERASFEREANLGK